MAVVVCLRNTRYRRIGIVIPVKNEEALLPGCLRSIEAAAARVPMSVDVLVVLDDCEDGSAAAAARFAAGFASASTGTHRSIALRAGSVGAARRAGMAELIRDAPDPARLWLATTDADSEVPPEWLVRQLQHASHGVDAVVGTVRVQDWGARPDELRVAAEAAYWHPGRRRIHGANLSFSALAYLSAGGFGDVRADEDVALVHDLESSGATIAWAADLPVATSARSRARAPRGFAGYLDDLERCIARLGYGSAIAGNSTPT